VDLREPGRARGGASAPALLAQGISKSYGRRQVLRGLDLEVRRGEIHGLLGQNGSGKSTFIKVLSGYHAPDPGGTLLFHGREVTLPVRPGDLRGHGVAFVHQDLGLVESATVLENLRVGRFDTGAGWRIRWRDERREAQRKLADFGIDVGPDTLVGTLPAVDRAMIAVLRALDEVREASDGFLVLDEPTAFLPRDGVTRLFDAMRRVAADGFGVIFVTHRLDEVRAITDRVSIIRDGELVETADTATLSEDDLVDRILGFSLDRLYPEPHTPQGETVVRVRGASGSGVRGVDLDLRGGEVVGVTGLVGMGYDQVPYLLFGARPAIAGTVEIGGERSELAGFSPRKAVEAGLALLPANRLREGGAATATLAENVSLVALRDRGLLARIRGPVEAEHVAGLLDRFQVVPPEPARALGTLSGGNQQKALLAKWFTTSPSVFLMHEPTQGVDVGARKQIFQVIRDAAEAGTSFVIASAEYEDLAHLCDRVFIFRDGEAVAELSGDSLSYERIVEQCYLGSPKENA
jgi:ribose transport system ATP-binding protein